MEMTMHGETITYPRGAAAQVRRIVRAADAGGTIQAGDALRLFPGEPEMHTTLSLERALAHIGARVE